jgi:hypothetical protein
MPVVEGGNFEPVVFFYPGGQVLPHGAVVAQATTVRTYMEYLARTHVNMPLVGDAPMDLSRDGAEDFIDTAFHNRAVLAFGTDSDADFPVLVGDQALSMPLAGWQFDKPLKMMTPRYFVDELEARIRAYGVGDAVVRAATHNRYDLAGWLQQNIVDVRSTEPGACSYVSNPSKLTMKGATSLLFAKHFCAKMDRATQSLNRTSPLFTIQSCNNLHNLSAYLTFYAFKRCALPGRANWIVNFDGHADRGDPKTRHIRVNGRRAWVLLPDEGTVENGPWGAFLPRFHANSGYVVLQTGTDTQSGEEGVFRAASGADGAPSLTGEPRQFSVRQTLLDIDKTVPDGSNVYITIDRDCMKCSATGWGSGSITPAQMREEVLEAIDLLVRKRCNFVGFDISGFPGAQANFVTPSFCNDDHYINNLAMLDTRHDLYARLLHDLEPKEDPWFMLMRDVGIFYRKMNSIDPSRIARGGDPRCGVLMQDVPDDATWADAYAIEIAAKLLRSGKARTKLYLTLSQSGGAKLQAYVTPRPRPILDAPEDPREPSSGFNGRGDVPRPMGQLPPMLPPIPKSGGLLSGIGRGGNLPPRGGIGGRGGLPPSQPGRGSDNDDEEYDRASTLTWGLANHYRFVDGAPVKMIDREELVSPYGEDDGPSFGWTEHALETGPGGKQYKGGSFGEYRELVDKLRRYSSAVERESTGEQLRLLKLMIQWGKEQLENHSEEACNPLVADLVRDAEARVQYLS